MASSWHGASWWRRSTRKQWVSPHTLRPAPTRSSHCAIPPSHSFLGWQSTLLSQSFQMHPQVGILIAMGSYLGWPRTESASPILLTRQTLLVPASRARAAGGKRALRMLVRHDGSTAMRDKTLEESATEAWI
ncbi:hypothetical protein K493DRAFT_32767 [Basidiobolus meristosporus CBS 931.73]|uniref:Uncharacterized protein n=1 Tax=Basidiobolus meristosporus CBS 931.73 TaxID=1314790 RepID=A0A1Y1Y853_9FUNG|nr:hypothetical protein K493DRAFT_32767 [Basidiobolus meristosporus CBS 931.73]|eukprot:ORX94065.1 hypothetical protein K493DRAFT_32767 [Basidiobolus meristosporus CBS 931.73]